MTKEITREYFEIFNEFSPNTLLSILNDKSLKILTLKIIYDGSEIYLQPKNVLNKKEKDKRTSILLKDFLLISPEYKCQECKKNIETFDFYVNLDSNKILLCKKCHQKIKEQGNYISFDNYISKCDLHDSQNELYCLNCNKNICDKCKSEHKEMGHEFVYFSKIVPKDNDICIKKKGYEKAKKIIKLFKTISEIKLIELNINESNEINAFIKRLTNEIKYAGLIISAFLYFFEKKAFCYELISNFNELKFNEKIQENINFSDIFQNYQNLLEPLFHILMKSPDTIEYNRNIIIPICQRKNVKSDEGLNGEIRGIIELKEGFFLAGTKEGDTGIYDSKELKFKSKLDSENLGITRIYQLSKIKDDNLDLIAISSNLSDIIIISVFHKEKNKMFEFYYKLECQIKSHSNRINRIIQLSNNMIVSSSHDEYVIFWEKVKNNDAISLQCVSKINLEMSVHNLIECQYTNELICNNVTINLKNFTIKRNLDLWYQDESFNCAMCLFNKKYLAYVSGCDGVGIIDMENISKTYYITAKYDYVDAVYTIDDETLCICTRDLYNIFQPKYSQQYRLIENKFREIGKICHTGTCNCFMNDSEGNFIMGNMSGDLIKYIV